MERTEALDAIRDVAVEVLSVEPDTVTEAARFKEDLEADSLDLVELVMGLEERFDIEVPEEDLVRRLSGRWICRASGHPYHDVFNPPRVAGICEQDGSELYQRADDRADVVQARLDAQLPPLSEVVDHYRRAGVLAPVDGGRPVDTVTEALLDQVLIPDASG